IDRLGAFHRLYSCLWPSPRCAWSICLVILGALRSMGRHGGLVPVGFPCESASLASTALSCLLSLACLSMLASFTGNPTAKDKVRFRGCRGQRVSGCLFGTRQTAPVVTQRCGDEPWPSQQDRCYDASP